MDSFITKIGVLAFILGISIYGLNFFGMLADQWFGWIGDLNLEWYHWFIFSFVCFGIAKVADLLTNKHNQNNNNDDQQDQST